MFGPIFSHTMAGVPFGPAGAFAEGNAGFAFVDFMTQQTLSHNMETSNDLAFRHQMSEREGLHRLLGNNEAGRAATGFNVTNMFSDILYRQTVQPDLLLSGVETMQRYMGAGNPLFAPAGAGQDLINQSNLRAMAAGNMLVDYASQAKNLESLGVLGGDAGQAFAELGRRGFFSMSQFSQEDMTAMNTAYTNQAGGDPDAMKSLSGDLNQRIQAFQLRTAEAIQTMNSFRSVFQGSLAQALDAAEQIVGVDIVQSFGSRAQRMAGNQLAAVGGLTGYGDQIGDISAGAGNLMEARGINRAGAFGVGMTAAMVASVGRNLGVPDPYLFSSPEAVLSIAAARGVDIQESQLARSFAGAAALITGAGGDDALVRQTLGAISGTATPDAIVGAVRGLAASNSRFASLGNITGQDLANYGKTIAGTQERLAGRSNLYVNESQIATRNDIAMANMAGLGLNADEQQRIEELIGNEGVVTQAGLERAFKDQAGSPRFGEIIAAYATTGTETAKYMLRHLPESERTVFNLDAYMRSAAATERLQAMGQSAETIAEIGEVLGPRGQISGLAGLRRVLTAVGEKPSIASLFAGGVGAVKFEGRDILPLLDERGSKLVWTIDQMRDPEDRLIAEKSFDALLEMTTAGTAGGQAISREEQRAAAKALESGDIGEITKVGGKAARREVGILKIAHAISGDKDLENMSEFSGETQRRALQIYGLEQQIREGEQLEGETVEQMNLRKGQLGAVSSLLRSGKTMEQALGTLDWGEGEAGKEARAKFEDQLAATVPGFEKTMIDLLRMLVDIARGWERDGSSAPENNSKKSE